MSFLKKIKNYLTNPLGAFKVFEIIIAIICITIPALLRLADKDCPHFRKSISKYVYISNSYIYGMLMCIAAMLFIFNGAVYFKSEKHTNVHPMGKWYNVILGICLLGVIIFIPNKFPTIHLIFGGIFFLGNAVVIGLFQKNYPILGRVLALLIAASFVLCLVFCLFTLFWAEWLSLTVIGVHFILEASKVKLSN